MRVFCAAMKYLTCEFLESPKKINVDRRDKVFQVRKLELREQVLSRATIMDPEWSRSIIERVRPISDLVAADAQYHESCMKLLYARPKVQQPQRPGPNAEQMDEAMTYIIKYFKYCRSWFRR